VGHIVIGSPGPKPFWRRFGKNRDVVRDLIRNSRGVTIIVLDTTEGKPPATKLLVEVPDVTMPVAKTPEAAAQSSDSPGLTSVLSSRRIVIWDHPVQKENVLRTLVETAGRDSGIGDPEALFKGIMKREEQGSTFLNEGVAFPHVRVDGLTSPVVALGLTKEGVSDVSTEKPVEHVFLILSPARDPDVQVHILGLASRAAQNRHLIQSLRSSRTPKEAMDAFRLLEAPSPPEGPVESRS